MLKFKIYWDFDKEEKNLNEMASKGYLLKSYSALGIYRFTESTPQKLNYKLDYKVFKSRRDFEDYKALFEDAGWVHVSGTKTSGNQYFLPKDATNVSAEIFSTRESAALRYKKLYEYCFLNLMIAIIYLASIFSLYGFNLSAFGFLTPGLWQRTGSNFWFGFFIELPFVIFRVGLLLLLVGMGLLYGYWGTRAKQTFDQQMKTEG